MDYEEWAKFGALCGVVHGTIDIIISILLAHIAFIQVVPWFSIPVPTPSPVYYTIVILLLMLSPVIIALDAVIKAAQYIASAYIARHLEVEYNDLKLILVVALIGSVVLVSVATLLGFVPWYMVPISFAIVTPAELVSATITYYIYKAKKWKLPKID